MRENRMLRLMRRGLETTGSQPTTSCRGPGAAWPPVAAGRAPRVEDTAHPASHRVRSRVMALLNRPGGSSTETPPTTPEPRRQSRNLTHRPFFKCVCADASGLTGGALDGGTAACRGGWFDRFDRTLSGDACCTHQTRLTPHRPLRAIMISSLFELAPRAVSWRSWSASPGPGRIDWIELNRVACGWIYGDWISGVGWR